MSVRVPPVTVWTLWPNLASASAWVNAAVMPAVVSAALAPVKPEKVVMVVAVSVTAAWADVMPKQRVAAARAAHRAMGSLFLMGISPVRVKDVGLTGPRVTGVQN